MYRVVEGRIEVLLVHPGGPFFRNKDAGAWSIPKGEVLAGEDLFEGARREFFEELGSHVEGASLPLAPVRQKGGKVVHAWAIEGNLDTARIHSNRARIEWPPRSGRFVDVPEVDRAEFFDLAEAARRINPAQAVWLHELATRVRPDSPDSGSGRISVSSES